VPPSALVVADPQAASMSRVNDPLNTARFRVIDQCSAVIAAYRFGSHVGDEPQYERPLRILRNHNRCSNGPRLDPVTSGRTCMRRSVMRLTPTALRRIDPVRMSRPNDGRWQYSLRRVYAEFGSNSRGDVIILGCLLRFTGHSMYRDYAATSPSSPAAAARSARTRRAAFWRHTGQHELEREWAHMVGYRNLLRRPRYGW
jgi:hypothetical protein